MALTPEHAARILDLDLFSSVEDVNSARRKLAKAYHPDCCRDTERATRHMARINAAADTLIAFLKEKERRLLSRRTSFYRDFSAHRRAQATSHQKKQAEKAQPENKDATRACVPVIATSEEVLNTAPKDHTLIRFAAQAYSNVLAQIGGQAAGPTVDVVALKDSAFA